MVSDSLDKHHETVVKRLKCMVLPSSAMASCGTNIAKDEVTDADICPSGKFTLFLTQVGVAVDTKAISALCTGSVDAPIPISATVASACMYLQTMPYDTVVASEMMEVEVDGLLFKLKKGVHYFASSGEMAKK